MNIFWNNWQSRFSKRNTAPQHVNNLTDPHEIAEKFCQHYAACSFDSYADLNSITKLNDDFSVSDLEQASNHLKSGKAPGTDGIVKEHITFGHLAIIVYLTLLSLFNLTQHVNFLTHNQNHILDLVITSSDYLLAPSLSVT